MWVSLFYSFLIWKENWIFSSNNKSFEIQINFLLNGAFSIIYQHFFVSIILHLFSSIYFVLFFLCVLLLSVCLFRWLTWIQSSPNLPLFGIWLAVEYVFTKNSFYLNSFFRFFFFHFQKNKSRKCCTKWLGLANDQVDFSTRMIYVNQLTV